MNEFDLIIIGGGRSATLASKAASAGKKVALIERDKLGGTCPNRGCVPSKLLIGYADAARRIREAGRHHISANIEAIDKQQIFDDVSNWIGEVDPRYESRFPENVTLFRGQGKFISNKVVEVNGEQLTANEIVIASGARSRPAFFPELPVWTSDDIFPFKHKVPESIAIVGGGFIACELANFFQGIGIETTLLVRGNVLLPNEDQSISKIFKEEFTQQVPTRFGTSISAAEHDGEKFQLTLEHDGEKSDITVNALMYATGRVPNTENLGLENTDIELTDRGFIKRDDFLETAVSGVYAAGDVGGTYQLQHASTFEITYLTEKLLGGHTEKVTMPPMPHAVFSEPEIAAVGLTEQELESKGIRPDEVVITETNWNASARALSWRIDYPRTKFIIRKSDYAILGCHMIGPESSTMIHQVLSFMHLDNDLRKMPGMIHIHPSLGDAVQAAASATLEAVATAQATADSQ